jgi:enterochelin esterase-like enzyme
MLCLLWLGCQSGTDVPADVIDEAATAVLPPTDTACTATTGESLDMQLDDPAAGQPFSVGVYVPPCYAERASQRYPVLYLLSSNRHLWSQWGLYETAEMMLETGAIQPFIIVTPEANLDMPHLEVVIAETVVPVIDAQFRTIAQRDHRFIGGVSFGGALSWQTAVQYPTLFGGAGLFGAAGLSGRWQEEASTLLAAIPDNQPPFFYFDVGREDSFLGDAAHYEALLSQHGFTYTHVSRIGGHDPVYWQQAIPEYLTWFHSIVGQQAYHWQVAETAEQLPETADCPETTGTVDRSLTLADPALPGLTQPVVVYLPPCYHADDTRRYPVFYFLHGLGGGAGALNSLFLDEIFALDDVPPFIVVMPENGESYPEIVPWLGDVLVPAVDSTYRTIRQREYRGVGGPSRGGGLTVAVGIAHTDLFGQLGIYMSAHIHTNEEIAAWLDQVPPDTMPLMNISVGQDDVLLVGPSESLHSLLLKRHIPHSFTIRAGAHDRVFWSNANQLEFYRWQAAVFGYTLTMGK